MLHTVRYTSMDIRKNQQISAQVFDFNLFKNVTSVDTQNDHGPDTSGTDGFIFFLLLKAFLRLLHV